MKYNKEEWENLATCIKTEQVPPHDVFAIFQNNGGLKNGTNKKVKIGIVGYGFVGQAIDYAFTHDLVDKFTLFKINATLMNYVSTDNVCFRM